MSDVEKQGVNRRALEECHRATSVSIASDGKPNAVVRDQKPMSDAGLAKCLKDGLTPRDWYRLLNSMCFFWLTTDRLLRLLEARPYRNLTHTVLELDTASVIDAHHAQIRLSPMNSGCTKPYPWPRGRDTFLKIDEYPFDLWRKKRPATNAVVEFCVIDGIRDIADHVLKVVRMSGPTVVEEIWVKR